MIVTLDNNVKVPVHWNDRAYEADCAECGRVVYGTTSFIIKEKIQQHAC
jgi:hypothetical protein